MIKVIELFSGIGSQTQALKNIGVEHEIIATCEWSINSIISYGEIHNSDGKEYNKSVKEILEELKDLTFSLDTKTPRDLTKIKEHKLKLLYKNHINSKNLGSILDVKGENLIHCDLMTYSFPCQDLSLQGKQDGLYNGKSSSLLWQVERILDEVDKLPNMLLMENVFAILNKRHKPGLDKWKKFLSDKGYHNYIFKLKSSYYGVPQNRDRCFMISSLTDLGDIESKIKINEKITNLRIKDILEGTPIYVDHLLKHVPNIYEFTTSINYLDTIMISDNYSKFICDRKLYSLDSIAPTLTAVGGNSTIKVWENERIRVLNSLECWKLMGFKKEQWDKVVNIHSRTELVKQAGNSIVVPVLEEIFKNLFL